MSIRDFIVDNFNIKGSFISAEPYGNGHINDTRLVKTIEENGKEHQYILQKINKNVFKNPHQLMENYSAVTSFIRKKIKEMGLKNVLVSGIRPPSDAELFRSEFGDDFFLVAIVLESDRLRYERMVARGSARDNVTYEQFLALDQREEELFQTSKTIEMANYTFVRGDYSDEVYHEKIRKFFLEYCS